MASRLQYLEQRQATHYTIGRAIAALTKFGPLTSSELGSLLELHPRSVYRWLCTSEKIDFKRIPHQWRYDKCGVFINHIVKRDILEWSLVEL